MDFDSKMTMGILGIWKTKTALFWIQNSFEKYQEWSEFELQLSKQVVSLVNKSINRKKNT